jgi:flagellar biosynthetic protein FlhB
MAEEHDFESRTEAPTQRRRDEARDAGRVAFSAELSMGVVLLVGVLGLALSARGVGTALVAEVQLDLVGGMVRDLTPALAEQLVGGVLGRGLQAAGIILGLLLAAACAVGLAQAGFRLTPTLMTLNFARLSPFKEEGRLMSWSKLTRMLLMLLKLGAVGGVAYWFLRARADDITRFGEAGLGAWVGMSWDIVVKLALSVVGLLTLLGVADYAYQFWRHERSLRMTRQELKEDLKREEGDPQIKARIRKLQREAAQKRMFQEVKTATVVVTNPTHLAIALRYDRGTMAAPRVVAKGAGFVAKRIAEIARRHAVPVLERQSLARALFKQVKLNQPIPAALYLIVAELLAFVYRLRGTVPKDAPPRAAA